MSKRAKLARILGPALGFAGLILVMGADGDFTARKARIFAGLVRPLADVFGTIGAAGLMVEIGLLGAAVVWFWPARCPRHRWSKLAFQPHEGPIAEPSSRACSR